MFQFFHVIRSVNTSSQKYIFCYLREYVIKEKLELVVFKIMPTIRGFFFQIFDIFKGNSMLNSIL